MKVSTGVDGLDQILDGGLIKNRVVLVQGSAGTGKTTLGLQYLIHGAMNDQPGVLLSMEYEIPDLIEDMKAFGWDAKSLIDSGHLRIVSPPGGYENPEQLHIDELINQIFDHVNEIGAKRLVIDSINSLEISLERSQLDRRELLRFITLLRDLDCTTMLVAESFNSERDLVYGYLTHGVIQLYNLKRGATRLRGIEVVKMRGISHSNLTHSMAITEDQGIVVHPHEVDLGS